MIENKTGRSKRGAMAPLTKPDQNEVRENSTFNAQPYKPWEPTACSWCGKKFAGKMSAEGVFQCRPQDDEYGDGYYWDTCESCLWVRADRLIVRVAHETGERLYSCDFVEPPTEEAIISRMGRHGISRELAERIVQKMG